MFPSVLQLAFMFCKSPFFRLAVGNYQIVNMEPTNARPFPFRFKGVPESPRWLISKDRNEEALEILAYYHGEGDSNNDTVQFEYREIDQTLHMEKQVQKNTSYLDFFRTKGNRWRLAIIISLGLISQYSGNTMISQYQDAIYIGAGITNQTQKLGVCANSSPNRRNPHVLP